VSQNKSSCLKLSFLRYFVTKYLVEKTTNTIYFLY
jgi:hypothetical protein